MPINPENKNDNSDRENISGGPQQKADQSASPGSLLDFIPNKHKNLKRVLEEMGEKGDLKYFEELKREDFLQMVHNASNNSREKSKINSDGNEKIQQETFEEEMRKELFNELCKIVSKKIKEKILEGNKEEAKDDSKKESNFSQETKNLEEKDKKESQVKELVELFQLPERVIRYIIEKKISEGEESLAEEQASKLPPQIAKKIRDKIGKRSEKEIFQELVIPAVKKELNERKDKEEKLRGSDFEDFMKKKILDRGGGEDLFKIKEEFIKEKFSYPMQNIDQYDIN